jgi:hypothetical protein
VRAALQRDISARIIPWSIEEKILALQEKKAALADAILSDDPAHADKFGAQELDALFARLPTLSAST